MRACSMSSFVIQSSIFHVSRHRPSHNKTTPTLLLSNHIRLSRVSVSLSCLQSFICCVSLDSLFHYSPDFSMLFLTHFYSPSLWDSIFKNFFARRRHQSRQKSMPIRRGNSFEIDRRNWSAGSVTSCSIHTHTQTPLPIDG